MEEQSLVTLTPDIQTFKSYDKKELSLWVKEVGKQYRLPITLNFEITGDIMWEAFSEGENYLRKLLIDLGVVNAEYYAILHSLRRIEPTNQSLSSTNTKSEANEPPINSFLKWLELAGITRPDQDVLNRIVERFALRCSFVSNEAQARALYEDAQRYPGTTTKAVIEQQILIKLNGPLPTTNGNSSDVILLSGMNDRTKGAIVVKVLFHFDTNSKREIDHINHLQLGTQQAIGIIEAETHQVQVDRRNHGMPNIASGTFHCILMPRYVLTVAEAAGLMTEEAVYEGALRMYQALEYIHKCGLVHMDVKPANIFMDVAGNWFLGDFGSSVKQGANVESTSTPYLPMNCIQKPSRVEFDFFMLGVTLITALGVKLRDLQQNGILLADAEKIMRAAKAVQNKKLKKLIVKSIKKLLVAESYTS